MAKSLLGWKLSYRVLGGKLGADWERDRRDTLFLMGSIAVCSMTHVEHLPLWVSIAFAILFFWRLGLVLSGRWLPRTSVRLIAAFAAALGVYAQYKTLFGRDAGVALLILFLGLKLMEMQAKRDLFVVIFLCMLLLLLSFLYSQTIWMAILVTLALLTLVATLISMQFGYHEAPVAKRFKLSAMLMLKSLPVAMVLFLLFPRIDQPLWKLPNDANKGKTGLSDQMNPGTISDLTETDEIAFRAKFEGEIPAQNQLYWRGPVFGFYDGTTWRLPKYDVVAPPNPVVNAQPQSVTFNYAVTMEPHNRNHVFTLEHPIAMPIINERSSQLQADYQLTHPENFDERVRYTATSKLGTKIGLNETTLSLQNWLSLPAGFNPRTLQLALEWSNQETDKRKLIERTLKQFNEQNFYYTLEPPLYGKNQVDEFLFDKKQGFCEHYSQAFVVFMRALDIPSRVVTGYQGGELNPIDGYISVRGKDAHAWAEVWLQGEGWVRIDPTSYVAPERITKPQRSNASVASEKNKQTGLGLLDAARHRLDAVTNAWNQWMLNYDRKKQRSLMALIGLDADDWQQLVGLLAVLLTLVLAVVALTTLRRKTKPDPLEKCFDEACNKLEEFGIKRAKHETAIKLATRVATRAPLLSKQFNEIVRLYNQMRYAPDGENNPPKQLKQLQLLVKQLQ